MTKIVLPSDQDSTGRTLGTEEIAALKVAIESGTLTATKGNFAKRLENEFAELYGVKKALACASGTAAIHCAVAAIDPEPGDEIITSPITDMGAISPILYQGAIPVFADVDPQSCNVTAETIKKVISPRTKAIIVTHLFGNPCDMKAIMAVAAEHKIPVIEDCAQAFLARQDGKLVGTLGDIGCFSLQQGKHITCGEGGIVISNNEAYARRMYLFINKAWGYGDTNPDHYFLALNYRISELQAAVAVAQLGKLKDSVETRIRGAERLNRQLEKLDGIEIPVSLPNTVHSYWRYAVRVDDKKINGGNDKLAALLKDQGIFTAPRYIKKPAFACEVIQKQNTFGKSRFPFTLARPEAVNYDMKNFPGTDLGLAKILVLPFTEKFTDEHLDFIASSMKEAVEKLKV